MGKIVGEKGSGGEGVWEKRGGPFFRGSGL